MKLFKTMFGKVKAVKGYPPATTKVPGVGNGYTGSVTGKTVKLDKKPKYKGKRRG